MDTSEFGGDREHKQRIVDLSVGLFRALGSFPKPIVAAINGPAVAGGFALALLCDIRVASNTAGMGFLENRAGIPPSYAAARAALPATTAAELCLTGRLLTAEQALGCGVVSEIHEPDALPARAKRLAAEIAAAPPSASSVGNSPLSLHFTAAGSVGGSDNRAGALTNANEQPASPRPTAITPIRMHIHC